MEKNLSFLYSHGLVPSQATSFSSDTRDPESTVTTRSGKS